MVPWSLFHIIHICIQQLRISDASENKKSFQIKSSKKKNCERKIYFNIKSKLETIFPM